jgi:hypothetical protein
MPRYYFDLTNGHDQYIDDEGEELRDDREARVCARAVLTDNLGRSSDDDSDMRVTVRDQSGPRFSATLSIRVD